jgi:hypothetical protein
MEDSGEAPLVIAESERETACGGGAGVELISEPDRQYEDLPVDEEPRPGLLEERMDLPRDLLQADHPSDARQRLERFLETMEGHELRLAEIRPTTCGNPVASILA